MAQKQLEDFYVEDTTTTADDGKPVPNQQPTIRNVPYKLAIIGEAPGADEVREGKPFVGASGRFLVSLLSKAGIVRDACFIGNICQHRPPGNDIENFSKDGPQFTYGLEQLTKDLDAFSPNVCLLLGKTSLSSAKGPSSISDWRGSLFEGTVPPFIARKCIASYHPAACLRQYEWTPLLMFDVKKALSEATSPSLELPERDLSVRLSADEIIRELEKLTLSKPLISIDIEGYVGAMSCISIAPSSSYSFIVPFTNQDGTSFYDSDTELRIWRALSQVLCDPTIPKVLQNALYDRFVLQYSYGLVVRGTKDDTMVKHHELYCELEKSLGFQASVYTREPFYKSDRKTNDRDTFFRYCCKDSAVTHEINSKLDKWLDTKQREHYQFNVALLNPLLYMELRGIRYDIAAAKRRLAETQEHINSLQHELNLATGYCFSPTTTKGDILRLVQSSICYKRDPNQAKKGSESDFSWAKDILLSPNPLTPSSLGRLEEITNIGLNIKSAEFKNFLYKKLELPVQLHPVTHELTTNYEALLKLTKKSNHPALPLAIDIGELRTRGQMLEISADNDGRVRCGYNIVGTESGRLTCYTSPTGSGYNLQTIPAENTQKPEGHPLRSGMRDLFVADEDSYLFQCDLSGADGWTVAARLASLGDSTMLLDYLAGVKPAKVLCYMFRHGANSLAGKTRDEIKDITKSVEKDSWDYFLSKIGQHGTCYLMGPRKLATQAFIQSEGKVVVSESQVRDLQCLFTIRYRIKLWHDWMQRHLSKQPYPPKFEAANGSVRKFFGRSQEILGEALAHEPQVITTYCTNLAAYRLWNDPDNRLGKKLRVEPLHQIHDAILGQFKIKEVDWAVGKIKEWFNNAITIAGQRIVIPFEGSYGKDWALDSKSKVGTI